MNYFKNNSIFIYETQPLTFVFRLNSRKIYLKLSLVHLKRYIMRSLIIPIKIKYKLKNQDIIREVKEKCANKNLLWYL